MQSQQPDTSLFELLVRNVRDYANGHDFEFEERICRPDGEERVLRSRSRVSVHSELGHGSTFTMTLPRAESR